ncbi:ABC transporter ATP-binding protein [Actinomyces howellii]|uniref:HMP/thiamine import ATP-binding protein YkoD n=1 Tax=Actinomyces howellii TaxID=52771 RepID=A0A3S4V6A2_9ACTO|nr:ABC transporter ATP-binding protein [Actinomyces howellii]VEG29971.1 Putative HMP/thiamine import ATP-binding protein YkoD [Actinomyces howellii]
MTHSTTTSALRVEDLSFTYEAAAHPATGPEPQDGASSPAQALSGVDLDLPRGSLTLVTGASGCGKSTLLKTLNGLVPHLWGGDLSGRVEVQGALATALSPAELGRLSGSVFQNPRTQFFTTTVLQELAFASENAGEPRPVIAEQVSRAATLFGITGLLGHRLDALSGGQLQRVACAVATTGNGNLLLLDEPSSNLSPEAIDDVARVLGDLKGAGWSVVVAEHRLHFLAGLADRVVVMDGGRVTRDCTGAEFFATPEDQRLAAGLRSLRRPGGTRRLRLLPADPAAPPLDHGISVRGLRFSYGRGGTPVLELPALDLPAGEVTVLTGDNGVGKSTLARVLVGLAGAARGSRITIDGKAMGARARTTCSALVMQDVNRQLFAASARQEVALGSVECGEADVDELLESFGLSEMADRHPMSLSGGQKQRLVVAAAVASDASFYVFDEPTSGVDHRHLRAIAARLRTLASQGSTVLVISHDPELIEAVADRECHLQSWTPELGNRARTWQLAPPTDPEPSGSPRPSHRTQG